MIVCEFEKPQNYIGHGLWTCHVSLSAGSFRDSPALEPSCYYELGQSASDASRTASWYLLAENCRNFIYNRLIWEQVYSKTTRSWIYASPENWWAGILDIPSLGSCWITSKHNSYCQKWTKMNGDTVRKPFPDCKNRLGNDEEADHAFKLSYTRPSRRKSSFSEKARNNFKRLYQI